MNSLFDDELELRILGFAVGFVFHEDFRRNRILPNLELLQILASHDRVEVFNFVGWEFELLELGAIFDESEVDACGHVPGLEALQICRGRERRVVRNLFAVDFERFDFGGFLDPVEGIEGGHAGVESGDLFERAEARPFVGGEFGRVEVERLESLHICERCEVLDLGRIEVDLRDFR